MKMLSYTKFPKVQLCYSYWRNILSEKYEEPLQNTTFHWCWVLSENQLGHLSTHLKTHSGEKTNKCNQCAYAASHVGNLRTHLKTHSGEKPHKCDKCNYACSQAGSVKTHLKIHSGEKLNKCNQCNYAFSQAGIIVFGAWDAKNFAWKYA